nr:DUF6017 domain-containing protein [Pseudoflavonifractor phocaeensis]
MAVFRVEKNRNYTVMSNVHLRDRSLPLKAKGLLSLILSLPDGWDFTLKGLAKLSADGLDSTRSAIRALEKSGYIIRRQLYDGQGRFAKNEYTVFESPQPVSPSSDIPLSGNPTTGNPATATPLAGSPMQLNTIGVNNQVSNTLLSNYPSINLDGMDAMEMRNEYEELIRENLEIDILSQDSRYDIARVNEMVEIMLDAICSQSPTIRINGADIPHEVVKSRFLKLDSSHIEYVLHAMDQCPSDIRNIRAYMLTTLYNAPVTMDNYGRFRTSQILCGMFRQSTPKAEGSTRPKKEVGRRQLTPCKPFARKAFQRPLFKSAYVFT